MKQKIKKWLNAFKRFECETKFDVFSPLIRTDNKNIEKNICAKFSKNVEKGMQN